MQKTNNNNVSDQSEFKEAEPITAEKLSISDDISTEKIKSKKWPIIMIIVLVLVFISTSGAWVYAQYMQAIGECGSGSGVCFRILEDGAGQKKVSLANLDPSKKYRIYIKRKVNDVEIDVGDVVLDMKESSNSGGTDPLSPTCTETDGGYNIDLKGTLTYGTTTIVESCSDSKTVVEVYCTSAGYERELYDCSPGVCQNGMCVQLPATTTPATTTPCTDTDGGVRFFTKGHLSWPVQGYEVDDICNDANYLTEYYCDNGMYKSTNYNCPSGCLNGACNKVAYGEMCMGVDGCSVGECKFTGKYGLNTDWAGERYCCMPNECASMHPGTNSTTTIDFSIPGAHCVGTGGVDENVEPNASTTIPGTIPVWTCNNGSYIGINDSCVEHSNHIEDSYGVSCCAGLVSKIATYDPGASWQNAICCSPNECADMAGCVPSGIIAGPNTCVNGVWTP